ncbi:MAG: hypothetical protein ACM33T_04445 [Solirubrobacterales bacterium]
MTDSDNIRDRLKKPLQRPSALPVKHASAKPEPAADVPANQPGALARLLDGLAKMLAPKPAPAEQPQAKPAEPPVFTVLVAAMSGDGADGAASQALFKLLESCVTLKVKPLPKVFQLDTLEDPGQVAATMAAVRMAVASENADLLVWGDVAKDGYRLRLSTAAADDERLGGFGPSTRVELPLALAEPQLHLLHAACLAAGEASTEIQRAGLRRVLPLAVGPLEPLAAKPSVQMTMPQQRTAQMVYGHVCAAVAQVVPPSQADSWLQKAVDAYRAAEKRLARHDPAWETGLVRRHIAAVLTQRAERAKEKAQAYLQEAVTEWRAAAEALPKGTMPQEWAAVQTRLGVALYRLDLLTGDTDLLREAVQALQGALSVYGRNETPQRWADIMHNLAQVLEVYGDQLKSTEVLGRAIDACEAVMEIRTRERTPLSWAATQNTLGSALFLLDRLGGNGRHLDGAIAAFQGALDVFTAHGRKGPAQVAARNLAKARKAAEDRKGRQVINPHWADD